MASTATVVPSAAIASMRAHESSSTRGRRPADRRPGTSTSRVRPLSSTPATIPRGAAMAHDRVASFHGTRARSAWARKTTSAPSGVVGAWR